MTAFIDGLVWDFQEGSGDRLGGMDLGQIACGRVDHGIQEAVDTCTGFTHAVVLEDGIRQWRDPDGDNDEVCASCLYKRQSGKDPACKKHHPPARRGMCQGCWIELNESLHHTTCSVHGINRRVEGIEGCPICSLDDFENEAVETQSRHLAEIEAVKDAGPGAPQPLHIRLADESGGAEAGPEEPVPLPALAFVPPSAPAIIAPSREAMREAIAARARPSR